MRKPGISRYTPTIAIIPDERVRVLVAALAGVSIVIYPVKVIALAVVARFSSHRH